MAALATASLSDRERAGLDRVVARLQDELGEDLVAVWLYGSRARGEPPGDEDSDVDVLVVVEGADDRKERIAELKDAAWEPFSLPPLSVTVVSPEWIAERRAIDSFYMREVDRDRIVLAGGEVEAPPGFSDRAPAARATDGLMARTQEYLEDAARHLHVARLALDDGGPPEPSIGLSYYAAFSAARAALSERDLFARTHDGTWHLVWGHLVTDGLIDPELFAAARALEKKRLDATYESARFTLEEARQVLETAERFVAAVRELIGA